MTEHEEIVEGLKPLFEKAEKEGLWFYSNYQELWFSPAELKQKQAGGTFLWGAVNWKLRNPKEHLEELKREVKAAELRMKEFELKILSA